MWRAHSVSDTAMTEGRGPLVGRGNVVKFLDTPTGRKAPTRNTQHGGSRTGQWGERVMESTRVARGSGCARGGAAARGKGDAPVLGGGLGSVTAVSL